MEVSKRPKLRLAVMLSSITMNIGVLCYFKYRGFFLNELHDALGRLGYDPRYGKLDVASIIIPFGISFYTFEAISYAVDVYRRKIEPEKSLPRFLLFILFFPQLVAGPIVRAATFLPQLRRPRRWTDVDARACLTLFLIGYFKKACISDNVAPVVDGIFADPAAHGTGNLWLGALLYTVRIYCDFSGYSDMAIGTAGLFGYRLTLNFDYPYLATSITDFWRRWHISLSSWFRDYLYLPLGGNRKGTARTYANLWLVFLVCGLWHGANWTFVIWGLYHGFFLVFERLVGWQRTWQPPALLGHAYVLLVAVIGWVFFRAATLSDALLYLRGMAGAARGAESVDPAWWLIVPLFAIGHVVAYRRGFVTWWATMRPWKFAVGYGAAVALMLPWVAPDYLAFIYFQF